MGSRAHLHVGREAAGPCKPPSPFSVVPMGKLRPREQQGLAKVTESTGSHRGRGWDLLKTLTIEQHSGYLSRSPTSSAIPSVKWATVAC